MDWFLTVFLILHFVGNTSLPMRFNTFTSADVSWLFTESYRSKCCHAKGWLDCLCFFFVRVLFDWIPYAFSLVVTLGHWSTDARLMLQKYFSLLCATKRAVFCFQFCLQVYCGSSRLKPQLKLSSVRVRKKHLATARDALTPKLQQNLQQPYAPWRNLWSILEHTLTRLRVGLDQTCVELHSGHAFGGEVYPVFLRNLAIANKRSDSTPSIDPFLHVCVTSKWLMQA